MSKRTLSGSVLGLLSPLLLFWLLLFSPALALAQSSQPSSQAPTDPWQALKTQIDNLPQAIQSYNSNLTEQIASLQTLNDSLTSSNKSLLDNNSSLTAKNKDLQTSLSQSQTLVETYSAQLAQLQAALTGSTQSITQARKTAKELEAQNGILKFGLVVSVGAAAALGGYYAGHAILHWW